MTTKTYYVYILANETNVAVYTGMTNDLVRRVYEHKHHADPGSFTAKHNITKLVYYDATGEVEAAIAREKQIKSWNRKRKNKLITAFNPDWHDLYEELLE